MVAVVGSRNPSIRQAEEVDDEEIRCYGAAMSKLPFTVYDILAYITSGAIVLFALDYSFGRHWFLADPLHPVPALLILLATYITGHVIAQLSSPLWERLFARKIMKPPESLLMGEKPRHVLGWIFPGYCRPLPEATINRIRAQATARGFSGAPQALFLHAYALMSRDEAVQRRLDEFRNLYGFARNVALALPIAAVLMTCGTAVDRQQLPSFVVPVLYGLSVVMLYRFLKFYRQYSYQLLLTYAEADVPPAHEGV